MKVKPQQKSHHFRTKSKTKTETKTITKPQIGWAAMCCNRAKLPRDEEINVRKALRQILNLFTLKSGNSSAEFKPYQTENHYHAKQQQQIVCSVVIPIGRAMRHLMR